MSNLAFHTISPALLRRNPWNTNKCPPENEAKIRASIERNGLFKPILVRRVAGVDGYEIVGGEHRWEQACELGLETVPIVDLGEITELRAKEIGVIDNARYGQDDALSLAELLKELGEPGELQEFLPYVSADLDALFSATSIALDELDLSQSGFDADPDEPAPAPDPKPTKTHTITRFKLSLEDAERVTALIADTQKAHGYTAEDQLTNAGDALIHILKTAGVLS